MSSNPKRNLPPRKSTRHPYPYLLLLCPPSPEYEFSIYPLPKGSDLYSKPESHKLFVFDLSLLMFRVPFNPPRIPHTMKPEPQMMPRDWTTLTLVLKFYLYLIKQSPYTTTLGKLVCERRAESGERRAENSIWDMNWEGICTYNRGNEWKTSYYF